VGATFFFFLRKLVDCLCFMTVKLLPFFLAGWAYRKAVEWKEAVEIRGVGGRSACGGWRSLERQFQHHEEAIMVVSYAPAQLVRGQPGQELTTWMGIECSEQQQSVII
jgi:hypothetical protein